MAEDKTDSAAQTIQSAFSGIKLGGGISAGYFYASNPGKDTDNDAFLLSNLLVELSSTDEGLPVGFAGGFGESSTPSLLGTPENNTDLKIEYASVNVMPVSDLTLDIGLLQPNAGYESTYTFNNKNAIPGVVASQQPYNAYGTRLSYDTDGFSLWGGYYKNRLDNEEYNSPDYAWEVGIKASVAGNDLSIYNYHIDGQRNLVGAVVERVIGDVDLALNIDYWTWESNVKNLYGNNSSIGGAFYICPNMGKLSLPVRLEYINQDKSRMYIENSNTKQIYSATISPTWHFNENAYIRAESAYVKADHGLTDKDDNERDNRMNFALEAGFPF